MKPHKIYAEVLESSALEQFHSALELDFVKSGALMADAHTGYSLPIGGVVLTEDAIVPSWVGYDIGCGMLAIPTTFDVDQVRYYSNSIFEEIYKHVPVGKNHNKEPSYWPVEHIPHSKEMSEVYNNGCKYQLGTLGSGNHFIEIGYDENNTVWIVVHSGSRNIGHKTATHYMKEACNLNTGVYKAKEGHFGFDIDSDLGQRYYMDFKFCDRFALGNRKEILHSTVIAMRKFMAGDFSYKDLINKSHNTIESNSSGIIHRKGATQAHKGEWGIIAGSMKDGSFIVRGKGNSDSLWSCSHGAGRVMSRRKAKETIKFEDFKNSMDGIVSKVTQSTLDESCFAYKNPFEVIELQNDLIEVVHHIKPIINIKS